MGWLNNSFPDLDHHWGLDFTARALKYQNRDQNIKRGTNFAKTVPIGTILKNRDRLGHTGIINGGHFFLQQWKLMHFVRSN